MNPKIIFISWAPYCSRSDNIARELGGKSYMVYCNFLGSSYLTILFKYFFQTLWTFFIFAKERPDVVFVMSPSVFANIPVLTYCSFFSKKYIIDAHTGALKNIMWKNVQFLQRFFCRQAAFTIVTNSNLAQMVENWNAKSLIVPDVPIKCGTPIKPTLTNNFNVTLINTFATDEPIEIFLDATSKLPQFSFYITGKINSKVLEIVSSAGKNVVFTDFLPSNDYYGLLSDSNLIVVLTTIDDTMQRGAYEAIYLGKPIVTSDWKILRENFPQGAVFVSNTPESISEGIRIAQKNNAFLTEEAHQLAIKKKKRWARNKERILTAL